MRGTARRPGGEEPSECDFGRERGGRPRDEKRHVSDTVSRAGGQRGCSRVFQGLPSGCDCASDGGWGAGFWL